jgi:hypothetical protein
VIEFVQDSPDGVRFIEMFSKGKFDKAIVKEFMLLQGESATKCNFIKEELTTDLIMELLRNHYSEKYGRTEFDRVIDEFNILITNKSMTLINHSSPNWARSTASENSSPRTISTDNLSQYKVGQIAKIFLWEALESGKADEDEVVLMRTKDYSKITFGLDHSLLVAEEDEYISVRYYTTPLIIRGKKYRLCSQWFETFANNDRPFLLSWLSNHGVKVENYTSPHAESENYHSKPKQEFIIRGSICSKDAFEKHLQNQDSSNVNVTLFYQDGQTETRIWRVNNFGPHSNLSGNLASGFLRDWRKKSIVGIRLEI